MPEAFGLGKLEPVPIPHRKDNGYDAGYDK